MKYHEVENALKGLGLHEVTRTKKAIGFSHSEDSTVSLYVNTETKSSSNTLVIHPSYESQKEALLIVHGVIAGTSRYRFSSNYRHFPKTETPAGKENYHGIPFGFDDSRALEAFLNQIGIGRVCAPKDIAPPSPKAAVQNEVNAPSSGSKALICACGVICALVAVIIINALA